MTLKILTNEQREMLKILEKIELQIKDGKASGLFVITINEEALTKDNILASIGYDYRKLDNIISALKRAVQYMIQNSHDLH